MSVFIVPPAAAILQLIFSMEWIGGVYRLPVTHGYRIPSHRNVMFSSGGSLPRASKPVTRRAAGLVRKVGVTSPLAEISDGGIYTDIVDWTRRCMRPDRWERNANPKRRPCENVRHGHRLYFSSFLRSRPTS